MSRALPPAALFLREPSPRGGELALIQDELDGLFIATPLDGTLPRVYSVTPTTEFFFPARAATLRILGPERDVWLVSTQPAELGRAGAQLARAWLPTIQADLAQLQGEATGTEPAVDAALPPRIAQRLGLRADPPPATDPGQVDLPDFGGDEPPRRR